MKVVMAMIGMKHRRRGTNSPFFPLFAFAFSAFRHGAKARKMRAIAGWGVGAPDALYIYIKERQTGESKGKATESSTLNANLARTAPRI
jgi:hypothetical protein